MSTSKSAAPHVMPVVNEAVAGSGSQFTVERREWSTVTHCGALAQPRYYYYVVGPALCDYIVAGSGSQVTVGQREWSTVTHCGALQAQILLCLPLKAGISAF